MSIFSFLTIPETQIEVLNILWETNDWQKISEIAKKCNKNDDNKRKSLYPACKILKKKNFIIESKTKIKEFKLNGKYLFQRFPKELDRASDLKQLEWAIFRGTESLEHLIELFFLNIEKDIPVEIFGFGKRDYLKPYYSRYLKRIHEKNIKNPSQIAYFKILISHFDEYNQNFSEYLDLVLRVVFPNFQKGYYFLAFKFNKTLIFAFFPHFKTKETSNSCILIYDKKVFTQIETSINLFLGRNYFFEGDVSCEISWDLNKNLNLTDIKSELGINFSEIELRAFLTENQFDLSKTFVEKIIDEIFYSYNLS